MPKPKKEKCFVCVVHGGALTDDDYGWIYAGLEHLLESNDDALKDAETVDEQEDLEQDNKEIESVIKKLQERR